MNYAARVGEVINDILYCVGGGEDCLFKIDLNKMERSVVCRELADKEQMSTNYYGSTVKEGNSVWYFPSTGTHIFKYDTNYMKSEWFRVPGNLNGVNFSKTVKCGNKVFLVPCQQDEVISFDLETKEFDFFVNIKHVSLDDPLKLKFIGGGVIGTRLIMTPVEIPYIVGIDIETKKTDILHTISDGMKYGYPIQIDNKIFMIPLITGGKVIEISDSGVKEEEYTGEEGMPCEVQTALYNNKVYITKKSGAGLFEYDIEKRSFREIFCDTEEKSGRYTGHFEYLDKLYFLNVNEPDICQVFDGNELTIMHFHNERAIDLKAFFKILGIHEFKGNF